MSQLINIFWYRRDLRLNDNVGLYHSLNGELPVLPVFIFDTSILSRLDDKLDRRITFIYDALKRIDDELKKHGSSLKVLYGKPSDVFLRLFEEYQVKAVFTNRDYEPSAIERDSDIEKLCRDRMISFHSFKDQVIFEKDEVVKNDGLPYTIFTPYSKKWKASLKESSTRSFDTKKFFRNLIQAKFSFPALTSIGFKENHTHLPNPLTDRDTILNYHKYRDIPYPGKTTRVSVHLRFGTISIRQLAAKALELNEKYLDELVWREFFMQVLYHFPLVVDASFQKKFEKIKWKHDESGFEKWCKGITGFPLIDAGMRELNETGFMHNRIRMLVSNFLTKILFVDWRWGEAYFASKLTDFELANNNGNWQWSAGTGCDAAPYFRIFNPTTQIEKFDPDYLYIKKWIPGFDPENYLRPMIAYESARAESLRQFKRAFS